MGAEAPWTEGEGLGRQLPGGQHVRHGVAGDRGEQDAVAVVAGGEQQSGQAGGAEQRGVVGGAGPQPGEGLGERQLGDAGHQFVGVAQQFVHPARGHRGVPAQLLAGRAEDQLAVLARHQVDVAAADHGPHRAAQEGRVPPWHGQPHHLPLHRPHGRQDVLGHPREPPRGTARGQHDLPGGEGGAPAGEHARGPVPGQGEPLGPRPVEDHPGPLAGHEEGRGEPARVDLVVAVHPQPAAHARREQRFQAAALPPAEPLRGQPRTLLQGVQFAQVGPVVGVERDGERAAPAVAEVVAGGLGQLGGEVRITAGGLQVEREQGLFAVVQFGDGGQHPGRHPGGPAAGFGIHHGDGQSAPGGPPGGDQSDEPAADDQDVGAPPLPPEDLCDARDMGVQLLPSPA